MIIDCHAHLQPPEFGKASYFSGLPQSLFDADGLVTRLDADGIDAAVVSNPMVFRPGGYDLTSIEAVKLYNDYAAEVAAKHKGRLIGFAAMLAYGGDDYLKEVERCIKECGLKGIGINSSVRGEYLDSPRAQPLFELACQLDVPIFVHPPGFVFGPEMETGRLVEILGRPFDTTLTITRMIFAGVFDRYPDLKMIFAHVGGAITSLIGRIGVNWEYRDNPQFGPWGFPEISKPPAEYLRMLYLDSMCFHRPTLVGAIETVGADHVLYGTDYPPVDLPFKRSLAMVRDLSLSEADKAKILGGTMAELLHL